MYEYRNIVVLHTVDCPKDSYGNAIISEYDKTMNIYAREGWRVISINSGPGWGSVFITFEREIRQ